MPDGQVVLAMQVRSEVARSLARSELSEDWATAVYETVLESNRLGRAKALLARDRGWEFDALVCDCLGGVSRH